MFSFGDEDDDDTFIQSIQPLPKHTIERSVFTAIDFDPDRFLSSRRHLGLERLKMELNSHLKSLKIELVELINRDYQDFINLSTNLKGVDKAIDTLQQPLVRMETQVKVNDQILSHLVYILNSQVCMSLFRMYELISNKSWMIWRSSWNTALKSEKRR